MNKQEYMTELEKALKMHKVHDIEDILDEYEQHFACKLADGYTQEEIAARLEQPAEMAKQFLNSAEKRKTRSAGMKVLTAAGLYLTDLFILPFFVLLFSWVIIMFTMAISFTGFGICLICNVDIAVIIPVFPYLGRLFIGISLLGLSAVIFIGAIYCHLFFRQLSRAYMRWHKNMLHAGSGPVLPPLSKYPNISPKRKRRSRGIMMIALIIFGLFLMAGIFLMFAYTGFKPFWHELGWFNYGR